jgi:hypothetical protein
LVDYLIHEGCNARAWVVFSTTADRGTTAAPAVPAGSAVRTVATGTPLLQPPVQFETLHDLRRLTVARNRIPFYTWGDEDCCLPAGATSATLLGAVANLQLSRGDAVLFEEVRGATSGLEVDADRTHRHVVRIAEDPVARVDPLNGQDLTEIRWYDEDALPFPLCLRAFDDGQGGSVQAAVARGNVALADHGRTVESDQALVPGVAPTEGVYRPALRDTGLTFAARYVDSSASLAGAASATAADVRAAVPAISLRGGGESWSGRPDLLGSGRFATDFVVEMEEDRRAHLRFGDGVLGASPAAGTAFTTTYRLGNGRSGNVGAEALTVLDPAIPGVTVRNPLAASGGQDPESLRQVRLDAPEAFRTQERAVTAADYAEVAGRHPDVSRAAATRRWTGSWYTMFLTVDRVGGRPVDATFAARLRDYLDRFRMAGYDLEIDAPHFVAIDLGVTICVDGHHEAAIVEAALDDAFGAGILPDGRRGFFHPDNFTFGQPVYLSQILATAAEVPGVSRVMSVDTFQRHGEASHGEIDQEFLPIHRLEIARLDNDPSDPEHGQLTLSMHGGI